MSVTDLRTFIAATKDPALHGKITALAARLQDLAGSDARFEPLSRATDHLWQQLIRQHTPSIRRAVLDVLQHLDELEAM